MSDSCERFIFFSQLATFSGVHPLRKYLLARFLILLNRTENFAVTYHLGLS